MKDSKETTEYIAATLAPMKGFSHAYLAERFGRVRIEAWFTAPPEGDIPSDFGGIPIKIIVADDTMLKARQ